MRSVFFPGFTWNQDEERFIFISTYHLGAGLLVCSVDQLYLLYWQNISQNCCPSFGSSSAFKLIYLHLNGDRWISAEQQPNRIIKLIKIKLLFKYLNGRIFRSVRFPVRRDDCAEMWCALHPPGQIQSTAMRNGYERLKHSQDSNDCSLKHQIDLVAYVLDSIPTLVSSYLKNVNNNTNKIVIFFPPYLQSYIKRLLNLSKRLIFLRWHSQHQTTNTETVFAFSWPAFCGPAIDHSDSTHPVSAGLWWSPMTVTKFAVYQELCPEHWSNQILIPSLQFA